MESRFKNWTFAMFQPYKCTSVPHLFSSYTEMATSEVHKIDGRDGSVIFLGDQSAKDAALWRGWIDITEKMQHLKTEPEPEIKIVKPKTKAKARRRTKVG